MAEQKSRPEELSVNALLASAVLYLGMYITNVTIRAALPE